MSDKQVPQNIPDNEALNFAQSLSNPYGVYEKEIQPLIDKVAGKCKELDYAFFSATKPNTGGVSCCTVDNSQKLIPLSKIQAIYEILQDCKLSPDNPSKE